MAIPNLLMPDFGNAGESIGNALIARTQRNRLAELLPGAMSGDETAQNRLLQVSPQHYQMAQESLRQRQTDAATAAKERTGQIRERLGLFGGTIANADESQYPTLYKSGRSEIIQQYPELAARLPEEWRPEFLPYAKALAGIKPQAAQSRDLSAKMDELRENGIDPNSAEGRKYLGMYVNPKGTGFAVTLPDGTQVQYGDIGGSKPAVNAATERMVSAEDAIARLDQIEADFDPDALRLPGRVSNAFAGAKDYVGMDLGPDEQAALEAATIQRAGLIDNLSRYVKDISGAAATDSERALLSQAQPYANDPPAVLNAKLKRARQAAESMRDRERVRLGQTPNKPPGPAQPSRNITVDY